MFVRLRNLWRQKPLPAIMLIALLFRLLAAFFSKGYAMHDDHFGPIEQPYMIIRDVSYWENRGEPHGHSIVYPAIHFVLFNAMNYAGIADPQDKMLVIRLLHAFYSMLIVYFAYRITIILAGEEIAKKAGLIMALFWILPFMSVRNLIEMVCIPPLMAALYYSLKDGKDRYKWLKCGVLYAIAFVFRVQSLLFLGGTALILFYQLLTGKNLLSLVQAGLNNEQRTGNPEKGNWKPLFQLAAGFMITAFLVQGIADWLAWGYPFAAFFTYLGYNASHSGDYTSGPFYNYVLLITGILLPPTSLLLLYGFARTWRRYIYIFLPVILYFLFHSAFPNKQERFILPAVPLIITLSVIGWEEFSSVSKYWLRHKNLLKGLWLWFWVVNSILLVVFTFTYSKKTRVEAMYYLSRKPDAAGVVVYGGNLGANYPPEFYLNKKIPVYPLDEKYDPEKLLDTISRTSSQFPNYAIIYGMNNLWQNKRELENCLSRNLKFETEIEPSFIDDIFYRLNPKHNKNQRAYIFKMN